MTAQRNDQGHAGGAGRDYGFLWCLGLGIGMIAVGLLGLPSNPLVGDPSSAWGTPLFLTGNVLDVIHLVTGAVLLYGALGLTARRRATLLITVGVIQMVLFVAGLISGDLFGALRYHASLLDQLLLLIIASINVGIGYLGRGGTLDSLRRVRTTDTGATGGP
jgi:hypothetical protein